MLSINTYKINYLQFGLPVNLVPRAHVPFGQHQDTCLGADQKARGLWERDWLPVVLIPDHAQVSLYRLHCLFESPPPVFIMFIKPVHFLNLDTQNAPDCFSEHLNCPNFPAGGGGGISPDTPSCSGLRRSAWPLGAQTVSTFFPFIDLNFF